MRIVTLATCHNRREKTLRALADLHSQELPESVSVEHVIVDDGSTDGTSEAVAEQFPDVEIVPGTGGLFWAGGMRHGWEESVKHKAFDFLFVYNDDVRLKTDALARLMETSSQYMADGGVREHVVVGAFQSNDRQEVSYGGVVSASKWHPLRFKTIQPANNGFQLVDTLNMNGACLKGEAIEKVGFLSEFFQHGRADYEYGLKLRRVGGEVILASGYLGACDRNKEQDQFPNVTSSLIENYRSLLSEKKEPVYERLIFCWKHGGWLWPVLWILPYVTLPIKHLRVRFRGRLR